ncbi:MAG: DUF2914 domain-containing protein [Fibrobacterales bacterium]
MQKAVLSFFDRYRRFIPAGAFVGGFLWDSITLGVKIEATDLWILTLYYIGASFFIMLLSFEKKWRWYDKYPLVLQFLQGSLFSALVVFYFKSSHSNGTYFCVAILGVVLCINEFWEGHLNRRGVLQGVYTLCAAMYLNFLIPHLVGSLSFVWFILSLLIALVPSFYFLKISRLPLVALRTPLVVAGVLMLLFVLGLIPPVPLVLKDQVLCRDLRVSGSEYSCVLQEPSFLERVGLQEHSLTLPVGEKIWCMTSVFAPLSVTAALEHRWLWFNSETDEWVLVDTIPFILKGGRDAGWRFYSSKARWRTGLWRIEIAIQEGGVIGYTEMEIFEGAYKEGDTYTLQ